jgi:hypothetical protein
MRPNVRLGFHNPARPTTPMCIDMDKRFAQHLTGHY